jgi:hypothetical protein
MKEEQEKKIAGDTHFKDLTPEQKLLWLSQAALFVFQFKGKAKK